MWIFNSPLWTRARWVSGQQLSSCSQRSDYRAPWPNHPNHSERHWGWLLLRWQTTAHETHCHAAGRVMSSRLHWGSMWTATVNLSAFYTWPRSAVNFMEITFICLQQVRSLQHSETLLRSARRFVSPPCPPSLQKRKEVSEWTTEVHSLYLTPRGEIHTNSWVSWKNCHKT